MTLTETTPINGGPDFKVVLVPDLGALAPMRREATERLGAHGLTPETVDTVLLVLSELGANAIQRTAQRASVLVRVWLGDTTVILEVENVGSPFDDRPAHAEQQVSSDSEGGRGLVIVRALSSEVLVRHHDGRCIVRAVVPLG